LTFKTFPADILALKMDKKKLIEYHIAISQKLKVLKLNHFHVIFSIAKAKKCYPIFSGTEEVFW